MQAIDGWTTEYCGLTHLGELSDQRRATVRRFPNGAELTMWTRGQGFNPPTKWYDDVPQAKTAGARWIGGTP